MVWLFTAITDGTIPQYNTVETVRLTCRPDIYKIKTTGSGVSRLAWTTQ